MPVSVSSAAKSAVLILTNPVTSADELGLGSVVVSVLVSVVGVVDVSLDGVVTAELSVSVEPGAELAELSDETAGGVLLVTAVPAVECLG
jgi:hypothetical protein